MPKATYKNISRDLKNNIRESIISNLDIVKQLVIDKLETAYDQMLNTVRFPKGSLMVPANYLSDFKEAMYDMEWVVEERDSIVFSYPNEESFEWTVDLEPIKVMVEGVRRSRYPYIELTKEQARKIGVAKKDLKGLVFRVRGATFYLVIRTPFIKSKMEEYSIPERIYPLSKSGPINIFEDIDDFVSEKMEEVADDVSEDASRKTYKKFKG